jgi:hypothetical protein
MASDGLQLGAFFCDSFNCMSASWMNSAPTAACSWARKVLLLRVSHSRHNLFTESSCIGNETVENDTYLRARGIANVQNQ